MNRQFHEGDPEVFDLAWLSDQELEMLQGAMLSNDQNAICAYWLRSLNEQAALRTGKLRIIPGAEARDPDFEQYSVTDLHAAQSIFGAIANQLTADSSSAGQCFCEMLVQCCRDGLERKRESLNSAGESLIANANRLAGSPPVGICSDCREFTRDAEQISQMCRICKTGLYLWRRRARDWLPCAGCVASESRSIGNLENCYLCRDYGWTANE
jgi:hypothetical protein